jgi:hypothetical protein
MTVLTGRCGQDVARVFALGDPTVVTTDTVAGDTHMIVTGTHPGNGIVAVIAGIRAHDMPGMFAFADHPVVATLTTSNHCDVVDSKHVGPYRG